MLAHGMFSADGDPVLDCSYDAPAHKLVADALRTATAHNVVLPAQAYVTKGLWLV